MKNIVFFAEELESIILNNLDGGLFNVDVVQKLWEEKYPDVAFKSVFTKLFAQNKVGLAGKNLAEYRDTKRTD